MGKGIDELVAMMRTAPANVRFADAAKVATHFFGKPRQEGSSHAVWRMPWGGDPRVNLQNERGKAKAYQIRQLLAAIDRRGAEMEER